MIFLMEKTIHTLLQQKWRAFTVCGVGGRYMISCCNLKNFVAHCFMGNKAYVHTTACEQFTFMSSQAESGTIFHFTLFMKPTWACN